MFPFFFFKNKKYHIAQDFNTSHLQVLSEWYLSPFPFVLFNVNYLACGFFLLSSEQKRVKHHHTIIPESTGAFCLLHVSSLLIVCTELPGCGEDLDLDIRLFLVTIKTLTRPKRLLTSIQSFSKVCQSHLCRASQ